MKNQITTRQKELLKVIYSSIRDTGYPPTLQEMKESSGEKNVYRMPSLRMVVTKTSSKDCSLDGSGEVSVVVESTFTRYYDYTKNLIEGKTLLSMKYLKKVSLIFVSKPTDQEVKKGVADTIESGLIGFLDKADIKTTKDFIESNFVVPESQVQSNSVVEFVLLDGKYSVKTNGKQTSPSLFQVKGDPNIFALNPPNSNNVKDRKDGKFKSIKVEVFDDEGKSVALKCFVGDEIGEINVKGKVDEFLEKYVNSYFKKLEYFLRCVNH